MVKKWVVIKGEVGSRSFDDETQIKLFRMWKGNEVFDTRLEAIEFKREYEKITVEKLQARLVILAESVYRNKSINKMDNASERELWEIGEAFGEIKQNSTTGKY